MSVTLLRPNDYVLTNTKRPAVLLSLDSATNSVLIAYVDEAGEYDPDDPVSLPRSCIIHIISNLDDDPQ